MSTETSTWLNQNVLVGFTDKRGNAWHYRASDQGDEPNHYPGAIPVEDVHRRLFHWKPVEGTVETTYVTDEGVTRLHDPDRKTIIRPDTGTVLGVFKQGFRIHEYGQWLVSHVETLLDADLAVGSAGLLRGGAVAWVQVEMAETVTTPQGVEHRPFLTAATSLDGSLATTYLTGTQVVVCDNTLAAAMGDHTSRLKIKHSRHSLGRVTDVRDALGLVIATGEAFDTWLAEMCQISVSNAQWEQFVAAHTDPGRGASVRSVNLAQRRADDLRRLWAHDERVKPWAGTAYGVVAAVNTYAHHLGTVRNMPRAERNALRAITGETAKADAAALATLERVLAA